MRQGLRIHLKSLRPQREIVNRLDPSARPSATTALALLEAAKDQVNSHNLQTWFQ